MTRNKMIHVNKLVSRVIFACYIQKFSIIGTKICIIAFKTLQDQIYKDTQIVWRICYENLEQYASVSAVAKRIGEVTSNLRYQVNVLLRQVAKNYVEQIFWILISLSIHDSDD